MDILYGPGCFLVVFTAFILNLMFLGTFSLRQVIVTILVLVWSLRLSIYVYIRNHGKPEDYRYAAMRKSWERKGKNIFFKSLTKIYLLQGLIIFIVVFPVLWINVNENPPLASFLDIAGITLWIGLLIWILGFYFETIGDYQLYKFKNNLNRTKKVMDHGLWKYTQHPNYFGEVIMWWGVYIIALGVPYGFITIFGPLLITFMIIRVSGVKLLNKRYEGNDEYAQYRKRTSFFFPWFPKKK